MSSKLIPSNPADVMVIRNVTPNIVTLGVPFLRFGQIKIGGRATIVKLNSGALAVFSPVALTPAVKSKLTELGNDLKYIAAPDMEHHIFLNDWYTAFPSAKIIGPHGLTEKRAKDSSVTPVPINEVTPELRSTFKLGAADFDTEFDVEYVHEHANKEIAFLHKPSKTLIQADLLFNLPATEQYSKSDESPETGIPTKLFNAIQHTKGAAMGQKRFLWYGASSSDREGFNKGIQRINTWDFNRIIPCHGDVIESDAKGIFQKVFEWHLAGSKPSA